MERLIKFRSCPLCGSGAVSVLTHLSYALFDDSPLSRSYDLVSCERCGFIYCDTESTVSDFYAHYTRNQHYLAENCGTGSLTESEQERYASVLDVLRKYQPDKEVRIIDIGSAKGGFVSYLKSQGYKKLLAIDLLPECVDYVRANGINAEIGSAEQLPIGTNSVNIAILSHVLEHMLDLQTGIAELCRVVTDGGLVYAEVPSIEYGCSFEKAPMWDFLCEHINYFSTQHLISLFENNHFSCLESNTREIHLENGIVKRACAVFQKNELNPSKAIEYHSMVAMLSGIFESFDKMDIPELKKIIADKTPCYVWGMSTYTQLLISKTLVGKCNIIAFLDQSEYKQTKTINRIPVKSPELLKTISTKAAVIFPAEPYAVSMNRYLDKINFTGQRIVI